VIEAAPFLNGFLRLAVGIDNVDHSPVTIDHGHQATAIDIIRINPEAVLEENGADSFGLGVERVGWRRRPLRN